ncbi:hypothetical protein Tco_1375332 [Tanacetum coccineum]
MSMTIQSSVKDKILATSSETSKVENAPAEMLRDLDQQMEKRADDDAAESVSDAIRFEYCLASSSGWTKSPVLWAEIGESSLIGPELVQETTDKVVLIKEKLKAARDRQKSCADNRRKPLEFEVGERVMLKVSPWKGVIRFGKKGKLAPRYVGPFEILERIGPVAYQLRFPEELSRVDKTLCFVEEPVKNSDCEVMRLKCSRMVIVKSGYPAMRTLLWASKVEDFLKISISNLLFGNDRVELLVKSRDMISKWKGYCDNHDLFRASVWFSGFSSKIWFSLEPIPM